MVSKKKYPTRINKTLLERFFVITLYVLLYFSAVIKKKSSGDIFIVIIFHPAEFLWRQFFYCGAIMLVSKKSQFYSSLEIQVWLTTFGRELIPASKMACGGFHLHLLVFPFVYQFNSRIGVLVHSSFANDQFRKISTTFQHHFKICLFLYEKECSFYTNLFCCTEMR